MKRFLLYLLASFMTLAVGCEKFDDSAIWDKFATIEERITALEQLCSQMNTNITSLQSVVTAMQDNDYVTSIAPIQKETTTIGYVLTFSKSGSVTIYSGNNGIDGYIPRIGVKQDSDGVYYWTLESNYLLDSAGNKIEVKSSVTPKLKIENDYWYVSFDDGSTWTTLGKSSAEGAEGVKNANITNVAYDDDNVYITIEGGTQLVVSRHTKNNKILYTTTDGKIIKPNVSALYTNSIVSNVYEDGQGVITLTSDLTILDGVFRELETLASITLPGSIAEIGDGAFYDCRSLESITFSGNIPSFGYNVFGDCSRLSAFYGQYASADNKCLIQDGVLLAVIPNGMPTTYTIPSGVTKIGDSVFSGSSVASITVPNGVTEIGEYAFYGCPNLTSVTLPEGLTKIGGSAFKSTGLLSIAIPAGVTEIEPYTFDYCFNLTSVTLPEGLTKIGEYAFSGCNALTEITIPGGVAEIEPCTFYGCGNLTSVTLPEGLTKIGQSAFASTGLLSIAIPAGVTEIGHGAFQSCNLTSVTLSEGLERIGDSAFANCIKLEKITIPSSVISLSPNVFYGCSALEEVDISGGVQYLNSYIFHNCTSLAKVTIPSSIKGVSAGMFGNCTNLSEVYCRATTPPSIYNSDYSLFDDGALNLTIYVPTASVDAYKAAEGWSDYADRIEGYDFD